MLSRYVETVAFPAYPDERLCWIGHQVANGATIACSKASGFTAVREYDEEGKDFVLLVRERSKPDIPGEGAMLGACR